MRGTMGYYWQPVLLLLFALATSVACATDDTMQDDDSIPASLFVVSRHLQGRWSSTWTSACTRKQTIGNLFFENETSQFFSWRDPSSGKKFDLPIDGEGSLVPYLPFLKQIPRPRLKGVRVSYGYQLCTSLTQQLENLGEEKETFGPTSEIRVMRGFVFEVDENNLDVAVSLDRCVGGINRNYNLFLTTVGAPIDDSDAAAVAPMTKHIRMVRWQFRLPGNIKCGEGSSDRTFIDDNGVFDRAADDAFDVMVWTRTELPMRSFLDQHFSMIVFAGLFIVFRMFTSYRVTSQQMQNRRTLMSGVTEEVAANKAAFVKTLQQPGEKKGKARR